MPIRWTDRASSPPITLKGAVCVSQIPPNTNPDDTLPGFTLSTFYQAYAGYKANGFDGQGGNVLFNTPWAGPADTRLEAGSLSRRVPELHDPVGLDRRRRGHVRVRGAH